jgi:general secretion pathway protein G
VELNVLSEHGKGDRAMRGRVLIVASLALLVVGTTIAGDRSAEPKELQLLQQLPKDPLIAAAANVGNGGEAFDAVMELIQDFIPEDQKSEIDQNLAELWEELGFSLRDDLLAYIGPEVGFALDLPPIDSGFGAVMSGTPNGLSTVLSGIGIWINVSEAKPLDQTLRKLFAKAELELTDEDGLIHISAAPEGEEGPQVNVYYTIANGILAIGFDPERVRTMTGKVEAEARLAAGADFSTVFSHLDDGASAFFYLNLPRLVAMVNESAIVGGMLESDAEMKPIKKILAHPEIATSGWGMTTLQVGDGIRRVTYGPRWMSSGAATAGVLAAIAVPNLINATHRGRQKRTMADMRTIATCAEAYWVDNEVYPGPTEGLVAIETIAAELEPVYVRELPRTDGWAHPYLYWSDGEHYRIISLGQDGEPVREWLGEIETETITDFNDDIVYEDGFFVVYPEG